MAIKYHQDLATLKCEFCCKWWSMIDVSYWQRNYYCPWCGQEQYFVIQANEDRDDTQLMMSKVEREV